MFETVLPQGPRYDPEAIQPMRDELVAAGFEELRTASEVDRAVTGTQGTLLAVVNSVCGCAAGIARPAVVLSLREGPVPARRVTVFAGQDAEATARLRGYLEGFPPSSPSVALLQDGKVLFFLSRAEIQGRDPREIADRLREAFGQHRPGGAGASGGKR